jgi:hypothetical protein
MSNPWTKKNPLMSMWLSAANKAAGAGRGQATSAARREIGAAQSEAARQITDFWSGKTALSAARKKRRR